MMYWVKTANSTDSKAPAIAAQIKPYMGISVFTAKMKPMTAPVIIIPSTPRFKTPDFSTTASPIAARRTGVAEIINAGISSTRSIPKITILRTPEFKSVIGKNICCQQKEEKHSL